MANRSEIEKEIIQNLRVIFQSIRRHSFLVEKHCGVSAAQLWAMTELSIQPGLRVSDIAKKLGIKNSTASNMLDKIENKKFLERKRETKDQRIVRLYLTSKGKAVIKKAPIPTQGAVLSGLGLMSEREINNLNKYLGLLVGSILNTEEIPTHIPVDAK